MQNISAPFNVFPSKRLFFVFSINFFLLIFISTNVFADITGTVFRDLPVNGAVSNIYGNKEANEIGVFGITIIAYDSSGMVSDTTTSLTDGTYTLMTGMGDYRVEFSGWPSYLKESVSTSGSPTSIQFVSDGGLANLGLHNPADFSQLNPKIVTPVAYNGNPLGGGTAATQNVLQAYNYSSSGSGGLSNLATNLEVGSSWGLAYSKTDKSLYVAAVLKRHAGFGPLGIGGIYKVDVSNFGAPIVTNWLDLNTLMGVDVGLNPRTVALPSNINISNNDPEPFVEVGKLGIGDIDISDDETKLYIMNLNNNGQLLIVDIASQTLDSAIDIPNAEVACSNSLDVRPWGIKYYEGNAYIGVVCSGENTVAADMKFSVLKYDGVNFTTVLTSTLNYPKGNVHTSFPAVNNVWEPWITLWSDLHTMGASGAGTRIGRPQAVLSDLEFDKDGSLILGFFDRSGLQLGYKNRATTGASLFNGYIGGDILKATKNGASYILENNGSTVLGNGCGIGNNEGPGNGEFFCGDDFPAPHRETSIGALAIIKGSNQVALNVMDPNAIWTNGTKWLNNTTGQSDRAFRIYTSTTGSGTFGKSAGLGDIELLSNSAPIEIGNRAWCDFGSGTNANDSNGIQDSGEANINGLTIRMTCGAEFAETNTNATGNYLFTDINWNASINTISSAIPLNASCTISIDTSIASNITSLTNSCGVAVNPTIANATSALPDDDIRDSDGVLTGVMLNATVNTSGSNTTGNAGENDHSIDFGFGMAALDFGDAPDTTVGNGSGDYNTLISDNGPSHIIDITLYMGACIDDESDGQQSGAANGDDNGVQSSVTIGACITANDDEDSLTPPSLVDLQVSPAIDVAVINTTGNSATVACWIDYDGNGVFDNATERGSVVIAASGTATVTMPNVPATANADTGGSTYMRCRIASTATDVDNATGFAANGEVEDYPVSIAPVYTLGNYVWYDANQDGVQDVGELGVNGVTVDLYSTADCSGVITSSTTTNNGGMPAADGFYQFINLPAGDFCVELSAIPVGYSISPTGAGTTSTDSDAVVTADPTIAQITNIVLSVDDPDEDMGIYIPGSVSGLLWCESGTNANTTYDAGDGDALQNNITVNLYNDANCNNTIDGGDAASLVTQSTVAGLYSFTSLITGGPGAGNNPPGCYIVEVDTADPDLGLCDNPITTTPLTPDIDAPNPNSTGNDFGHDVQINLGNYVWYDADQDGVQDAGETGVNGVTATLFSDANCTAGNEVGMPVVTANGGMPATDGFYEFTGLSIGTYCVAFSTIPAGYSISPIGTGTTATDSNANPVTGQINNINLAANDPDEDMGIFVPGSVSGLVWCESSTNANITYDVGDADTLQSNIQVTLYEDTNCNDALDGTEAGTAVTQDTVAGLYSFTSLITGGPAVGNNPPGCYIVEVDAVDPDLGVCDHPITPTPLTPDIDAVTPDSPDNNFGNDEQLALGDYVWYDSNQDGVQDAGEAGINGVTVNLYTTADCSGAISQSTITVTNGNDGFYEFSPLASGDYCVEFIAPVGHTISPIGAGTPATDSNADPVTGQVQNIDLQATDPTIDMGVFVPGSVSGLVWCESDTNANTTYDAGDADTLQSAIQVTLFEDTNCNDALDGTEAGTAVTQDTVAGLYSFTSLITGGPGAGNNPPGCYIVEVDTADVDLGVCNNPITNQQLFPDIDAPNPDSPDNNFGHNEQLTIGDFVWYDNDQNGLQDIGEPGVNGITVELFTNATCTPPSSQSTTTANGGLPAADGWYEFAPLPSGDYCVQFSGIPVGWSITSQNQGVDDTIDSDADSATGQIQNIVLSADDPTNDMGIYSANGEVPGQIFCDEFPLNGVFDVGEGQADIAVTLSRDSDCDGTGDVIFATVDTDVNGAYNFTNVPVGLSPIPPNPQACYVLNYDLSDTDLNGCANPILPETVVVELSTDTPIVPPTVFGNNSGIPIMIPVNKWWALLILSLMIFMVGRRYKQN